MHWYLYDLIHGFKILFSSITFLHNDYIIEYDCYNKITHKQLT